MKAEQNLIQDTKFWDVITAERGQIPWRRKHGQRWLKRLFDVVVGTIMLISLSPLIILTALLVRITSPGPVLLIQKRVGLDGAPFHMLKFRSMRAETDGGFAKGGGEVTGNDPRLTPIGKWIRAWRFDELPQLFHVLAGTMSLVGPRPDVPANLGLYSPEQILRFTMPPGCTTWSVTRGLFANDWNERQAMNVEYVHQWSFWLDIKILVSSALVVLAQKNTTPTSNAMLRPQNQPGSGEQGS
jgi:lipopolysaccharide/colanic/teichoic acid biosynthesis glycosyltransferase